MYCSKCGVALVNGQCPVCGRIENNAANVSYETNNSNGNMTCQQVNGQDGSRLGYNILSFLFPLAGLIFYCVWLDFFPIRAKKCGMWALISVAVKFALIILLYVGMGALTATLLGDIREEVYEYPNILAMSMDNIFTLL